MQYACFFSKQKIIIIVIIRLLIWSSNYGVKFNIIQGKKFLSLVGVFFLSQHGKSLLLPWGPL